MSKSIADKIEYAIETQARINERLASLSNMLIAISNRPEPKKCENQCAPEIKSPQNLSDYLDVLMQMQNESLDGLYIYISHLDSIVGKSVAEPTCDRVVGK
jgi:hypothetical protein